jgi:hypothetical protein
MALYNEHGHLVVDLEFSNISQVTLCEPKGKHVRQIQRSVNNWAEVHKSSPDEMTAISIALCVLSVEPKLTLADLDDLDAADFYKLGEGLSEFRFFRNFGKSKKA